MTKPRRRKWIALASILLACVVVAWLFAGSAIAWFAEKQVRSTLADERIAVTFESIKLEEGGFSVNDLRLQPTLGGPPADVVTVADVIVQLDAGTSLRRFRPIPRRVLVGDVDINLSSELGSVDEIVAAIERAVTGQPEPSTSPSGSGEGSGDAEPETTPGQRQAPPIAERLPPIPIEVTQVAINGAGNLPVDTVTLTGIRYNVAGPGELAFAVSEVSGGELATLIAPVATVAVHAGFRSAEDWDVTLSWPAEEDAWFDASPLGAPARARLDALSFDPVARTLTLSKPQAETVSGPASRVAAESVTVELRHLPTSLEDLWFARLEVDALRASVTLPALDAAGDTATEGDVEPTEEPATDRPALWADRVWYEKIPQSIELRDAELIVAFGEADDAPSYAVERVDMSYALRAIRTQMDVVLSGYVGHTARSRGAFEFDLVWDWANERLTADVDIDALELGSFAPLFGLDPTRLTGEVSVDTRLAQRRDGSVEEWTGDLRLEGVGAELSPPNGPVILDLLTWEWAASAEPGSDTVTFASGDGMFGASRFTLLPTLEGFDIETPPFFDRAALQLRVPDQRAMDVFYGVPDELLGPSFLAMMEGDWGMDLDFAIAWEEPDEDGTRPIDIEAPTRFEVRDGGLALTELPPPIDVRRLNDAMTFEIQIPDAEPREISVPAPGHSRSDWVQLEDVSYFLVAALLYREDGRFFRNHGINWYQWRAVLEEAWLERELGRGASTISMQLVKNVFLTHERTLSRKVQELFLTYWMTRLVPKRRILEVYLNVIQWGPGVHGIVEAADYYFAKHPRQLTLAESVWLSSIVPAPVRRSRQRNNGVAADWSHRHVRDLMRGMADRGWITDAEMATGVTRTIRFAANGVAPEEPPLPQANPADGPWIDAAAGPAPTPAEAGAPMSLALGPQARLQALIETSIPLRP